MPRYLGQHFLHDQKVLQDIVDAISAMVKTSGVQTMREIGPGQGALTKHIYKLIEEFVCFEKDETMKKYLGQFLQAEQVVWGDVLTQTPDSRLQTSEKNNVLVVGNLPYYITSPIFRKFFVPSPQPSPNQSLRSLGEGERLRLPLGGVFLIQKEVADKIKSDATKKSYSRWSLNNHYTIEYLFTVPPTAFDPPPKIDSAVVRFVRKEKGELEDTKDLEIFLDQVSGMKRKTLGKIQKMLAKKGIDVYIPEQYLSKRLEALGWEEMREILIV